MEHGKAATYTNHGCRCEPCKRAKSEYDRGRRATEATDDDALSDLLNELFPFGLTDDCPARRKQVA